MTLEQQADSCVAQRHKLPALSQEESIPDLHLTLRRQEISYASVQDMEKRCISAQSSKEIFFSINFARGYFFITCTVHSFLLAINFIIKSEKLLFFLPNLRNMMLNLICSSSFTKLAVQQRTFPLIPTGVCRKARLRIYINEREKDATKASQLPPQSAQTITVETSLLTFWGNTFKQMPLQTF